MEINRPAAVAGTFYKLDEHELYAQLDSFVFDLKAREKIPVPKGKVKGLIVPHSGYELAGDVYGAAYSLLQKQSVDEVFILGFSHYSDLEDTVFADYQQWEIPLGKLEQSHKIKHMVKSDDSIAHDIFHGGHEKHAREHSIEVQLPWIYYLYKELARIIPIIVGRVSPRILASHLSPFIDADDIVIAAAELSHGFPTDYAEVIDATAISAIIELDTDTVTGKKFKSSASQNIATMIELAKMNNWKPHLVKYQNSQVHPDDPTKTVGYFAVAFVESL